MTRLFVKTANLAPGETPQCGQRHYLQLDAEFSESQARAAIISLLNTMPEQRAFDWLRSEFPEWFKV
jgi:hypothetical protein